MIERGADARQPPATPGRAAPEGARAAVGGEPGRGTSRSPRHWHHRLRRSLHWRLVAMFVLLALGMAVCNIAGALLGTRLALRHGSALIRWAFLWVLLLLIARFAWDTFA